MSTSQTTDSTAKVNTAAEEKEAKTATTSGIFTGKRHSTRHMVICAMFAAMLCVAAYISIPLPLPGAPHLTLINFIVLIIALLFSPLDSFSISLVWLILGIIGVPVFIGGKAGFAYLIQPWGAYTWAFVIVAGILPFLRGKKYNRIRFTIVAIFGAVLIDLIGMTYLIIMGGYGLVEGFSIGFLPFIPLDLVKAVVAAQIIPFFYKVMR